MRCTRTRIGKPLLRAIAIGLLLAACAGPSTTIEQSWRAPDAQLGGLRNVVTMAVTSDGTLRRSTEDQMAAKLAAAGIRATPMYAVLGDAERQNRDQAKAKLRAMGYDGVIALRLVSRDQELEYVPGSFDYYWGMTYDPGYLYSETVVRIETSAYSLEDNRLVWSAISRTVDPDSIREGIDEVTALAASQLQKQGVVAGTPRPPAGG